MATNALRFLVVSMTSLAFYAARCEAQGLASETPDRNVAVEDDKVIIRYKNLPKDSKIEIPRLFNPIRKVFWQSDDLNQAPVLLSIDVLPSSWILKCDQVPKTSTQGRFLVEVVGQVRTAMNEAIHDQPDGSVDMPACLGITLGKTLRFEPQPHKNTIGYWTQTKDRVRWPIQVDRGGEFNLGLLQGCGAGQGGSTAEVRLMGPMDAHVPFDTEEPGEAFSSLRFDVIETGHFQNFQWRHIGTVKIPAAGIYFVEVVPIQIAKAALMDIRKLQLNRLP